MKDIRCSRLLQCNSLLSKEEQDRISDAVKLLNGISRLPFATDPKRVEEIKRIYSEAKKLGK